jgi:predicted AlkP superfamily phosphohydrolase/phosphomutase
MRLDQAAVDWEHTRAWGEGGYHGRLFLNVRGREPSGVIDPGDYRAVQQELIDALEALTGPDGAGLGSRAYRPEEIYPNGIAGIPPDLTVYFGDLAWRSVGSVGLGDIYTFDNDTGPDEANHDWKGIFIANRTATALLGGGSGRREGLHICNIAGLIETLFAAGA